MKSGMIKLAATAALLAGASVSAHAYSYSFLSLTQGASTVSCSSFSAITIAACSAGFTGSGAGGSILLGDTTLKFAGTVGDFTINTTSNTSNSPGDAFGGTLNESSTFVTRTGSVNLATALFINAQAFGYTLPATNPVIFSGSAAGSSTRRFALTDQINTVFAFDAANSGAYAAGPNVTLLGCNLAVPASPGSSIAPGCDGGETFAPAPNPMYSMTIVQTYDLALNSQWNTTANAGTTRIPEPMSTALVGLGLLGAAVVTRRRAAKKA